MKRITLRLLIALLTFFIGVTVSVLWIVPRTRPLVESKRVADKGDIQGNKAEVFKGTVMYKGIGFSYSPSLASEVKAEIVPASPNLQDQSSKLEGIPVEHVAFTFAGSPHESSFWGLPEIDVYRLEDYEKALANSQIYSEGSREAVQTLKLILSEHPDSEALKRLLAKRPFPEKNDIPFLPFINAKQAFRARVNYVPFKNGRGIMFLSQYNIETSLINNQGLAYVFQGVTDDGTHVVSAVFPVAAPFLPKDFDVETVEEYKLPKDFYTLPNESKVYQSYLRTVVPKLEALPPDKYVPELRLLEELVRSLSVQGQPDKALNRAPTQPVFYPKH